MVRAAWQTYREWYPAAPRRLLDWTERWLAGRHGAHARWEDCTDDELAAYVGLVPRVAKGEDPL
jgi:hypothetical protein